jgi:hypothetical protein
MVPGKPALVVLKVPSPGTSCFVLFDTSPIKPLNPTLIPFDTTMFDAVNQFAFDVLLRVIIATQ